MAPEGWKLDTNEIQIDMYSLGIVLHEIAALSYPYQLPTDPSDFDGIMKMHLFQRPRPLSGTRPDLPVQFCQTVTRLMEKRPQDRFRNWSEVNDAITKAFAAPFAAPGKSRDLVTSLVNTVGALHAQRSQQHLEAEARAQEEQERRQFNEFQAKKLVDELKAAADEFNQSSPLGKITIRERGASNCQFILPFGNSLMLEFFEPESPMNLKRGVATYAARINDNEGAGLNFLLMRDGGDLYGRWIAVRARVSAITNRHGVRQSAEPFGFELHELRQIAIADSAMHIFVLDWPEAPAGEIFLEVVETALKRKGRQ